MPDTLRKIAEADRVQAEILAVSERLEFMQMTPQSCAALRSLKALVRRELPIALDKFYQQVRKTPDTRKFFSTEKDIDRAKTAQEGHWGNISDGISAATHHP
ncbi:protoglobin domain-containing protein [Komagataeibacter kakiaceti]|uniref:protoglobin domain-containing protein n=1 Tax=Komagataeibacter kakiaceti TaxID=943261 RepID=UPI0004728232|nr:protoglobin domain-containing protein [Komagataeibacter kakiaceti]